MYMYFMYVQVREMLDRFDNIPDMLELDHLTVSGDVTFGKNVSLKVLYTSPARSCWVYQTVVLSSCVLLLRYWRG